MFLNAKDLSSSISWKLLLYTTLQTGSEQTHTLANTTASAKANVGTNPEFAYCMQVQIYECAFTGGSEILSGKPKEK